MFDGEEERNTLWEEEKNKLWRKGRELMVGRE